MRKLESNPRDQYVQELYAQEDSGLTGVRERLIAAGRWGVNIGASEGKLLQVLMKMISAKKVVEIGTLYGYSAVWIARGLEQNGHLWTIERDALSVQEAKQTLKSCGVSDVVTLLEGEASEKLAEISGQAPFDLVFIDANKSAYPEYLTWAEKNVRAGGLVVGDNTFLGGAVIALEKPEANSMKQWSAMREFNNRLADSSRFCSILIPTLEGLSVAVKL